MKIINAKLLKSYVGKTALVRIDLNIDEKTDEGLFRLQSVLPTLSLLIKNNVRIILVSHKGRPTKTEKKLSLKPFAEIFEDALGTSIDFIPSLEFDVITKKLETSDSQIVLLENIRFLKGEEENDESLAKQLASLGHLYINDAFAVSHRAHASVASLPKFLPSYAGLCLAKEIKSLTLKKKPAHPFILIVGGAKVSDKLPIVQKFEKSISTVLLGGGAANTVLASEGIPMGKSLYEKDAIPSIKKYTFSSIIETPVDVAEAKGRILDIGPKTTKLYTALIKEAGTIVWSGPMGKFEGKGFEKGTKAIWKAVVEKATRDSSVKIIVGGGETIASLALLPKSMRLLPENVFLSTGGGAMLEFLSGKKLPGIKALK
ncbi:phosphoglycerate kinase [Candidatus Parcubacteria bacterium]|jgi:phosphoglycerate kinase|nr:MAG: phosphoglycerate kinase [Candidatus Parcubacteria bacterium]